MTMSSCTTTARVHLINAGSHRPLDQDDQLEPQIRLKWKISQWHYFMTYLVILSLTQGVYKSSLTNFQEISKTHLTNFQ